MKHPIQAVLDSISEAAKTTRSDYHLTLGELINILENAKPNVNVLFSNGQSPASPRSYRGYYSDLSFEFGPLVTVGEFLKILRSEVLDQVFIGYKGGDFVMSADTPLWRSTYGVASGEAIIAAIPTDDKVLLVTKYVKEF